VLRRTFGHADFRGLQAGVIGEVLAARSALAVLPTGGGKSLCYQIPALVRPGLGLVVSPLIALMADQLNNLPFAIGLSKKAHTIIKQNLVISMGMVAILVPLTISGIAHMGPAVIGHEGSTLVVVFNALRLLGYKK